MLRFVLINHSDSRGGASVVTYRLMNALSAAGVDARMIVMHKDTDNLRVDQAGPKWLKKATFLAEHAEIFARNGLNRDNVFKISTAKYGLPLHKHPWMVDADVVCLNWVNQGMLSLREVQRIASMGKRMIWTMHDMWSLTGVCHHAGTCTRYTSECGNCPLISNGTKHTDLSSAVFKRKQRLYAHTNIHFVAVSNWLAQKCRESALLSHAHVSVIPNAFPVDDFAVTPTLSREQLGLPANKKLIVMGAARLDDPIKNLPLAIDTFNAMQATDAVAVFYGNIRDAAALNALHMPYVHLGTISDHARLASLYAHATVVLSTSHYETLPGTIIEGMAAGATAVCTGQGGQPDIVDHERTGYIADVPRADVLAPYIDRALAAPFDRAAQHRAIANRFSADRIATAYLALTNP
jgi:glycosyltransferase involved in cell wall biosynthesis